LNPVLWAIPQGAAPPVINDQGISYVYVKYGNLYLMTVTKRNRFEKHPTTPWQHTALRVTIKSWFSSGMALDVFLELLTRRYNASCHGFPYIFSSPKPPRP